MRQVEAYRVEAEIIDWDKNILPQPQGPESVEALLIKDPNWDKNAQIDSINPETLDSIQNHNRTVGTFTDILYDKHLYYIDAKGTSNWLTKAIYEHIDRKVMPPKNYGNTFFGLHDQQSALHDHKFQKLFKSFGIRTHESVGYYKLKYIYFGNKKIEVSKISYPKKISLTDEKGRKIRFGLPLGFTPVQQIRAFATPFRVEDIENDKPSLGPKEGEQSEREKIHQAMEMLSQENQISSRHDLEEYISWFFRTMGKNLGIMHNRGYIHKYLHTGNVTLDARIVDLDSITTPQEEKEEVSKNPHLTFPATFATDYNDLHVTLSNFLNSINNNVEKIENLNQVRENCFKEFEEEYQRHLHAQTIK